MNFKNLLPSKKSSPEPERFLALEIHESLIKTAVWSLDQDQASIVGLGSFELWDSEESLINGVDASLTSVTKDLDTKPTKVILGLPEPWLESDKIHPTKTGLIKNLISELGLKPIGLVTSIQAVIHHLKKAEGVPPSAVLLEVYPDKVTVAVVKLGRIQAVEEVGRSGELSKDVQEGLSRLDIDQLPPRFILTNGSSLENEQQQLLSYPWQEKLPFLHLPKVEVLPAEFSITAVALAGGAEAVGQPQSAIDESVELTDTPPPQSSKISHSDNNIADIGFQAESLPLTKEPPSPDKKESDPPQQFTPADQDPPKEQVDKSVKKKSPPTSFSPFSVIKSIKSKLYHLFQSLKKEKTNHRRIHWIIPTVSSLVILIALIISFFFLSSAQVIVTVQETPISQTLSLNFGDQTDSSDLSMPIRTQPFTASVSDSIPTTGEALVGDKSSGTVILYNRTSDPITVKSGTEIESDNLTFIINTTTTVASKSANLVAGGEEYGKSSDLSTTAAGIGAKYNVSKETQFSIGSHSRTVIYAVAKSDFAGGSSRTVKAVSSDDQQKLLDLASQKITADIKTQVSNIDGNLLGHIIGEPDYIKEDFSNDIGTEANTLDLNLTGEVTALLYSPNQIIDQFTNKLISKSHSNMTLVPDHTQVDILSLTKVEDLDSYQAQVKIEGLLVPTIDTEFYVNQINGKSVSKVSSVFQTIPGYTSVKLLISPNVPLLSNYLPLNKERISFKITPLR
jgi:hypothetical protein